jgi:hypothetical protein
MGIEISTTGPLLDGRGTAAINRAVRRFVERGVHEARERMRLVAPVLTGAYRRSLRTRVVTRGMVTTGTIYSSDIPGKVRVIEHGFPPRRPGLKGRRPRHVFRAGLNRANEYVRQAGPTVTATIATELNR